MIDPLEIEIASLSEEDLETLSRIWMSCYEQIPLNRREEVFVTTIIREKQNRIEW